MVNLFPKNSKISQIYTRKHTLQNFLNFFSTIRTKKIQERKKEIKKKKLVMSHTSCGEVMW